MGQYRNITTLNEAFYELSLSQQVPDAALLDEFVRQYPEYADELTDFAIMLAVDSLREISQSNVPSTAVAEDKLSPVVSRAMSRFYNRLHAVHNSGDISIQEGLPINEMPSNPFAVLDRAAFRAMVQRLNVNTVFAIKLRDRQIAPQTIPKRFTEQLANELEVSPGVLMNYLNAQGQPQIQRQYYKADDKPELDVKQTFVEAVRTSGLSDEQQKLLLAL